MPESLESNDFQTLIEEIERYLSAVAAFRALGHEPVWQREELTLLASNETIGQMAGSA